MTRIDDTARVLNTVGLAAWFGGSLMGAVALANSADDATFEYENDAWRRWSPVQNAAIAAHLVGAAKLATTNKGRLGAQRGVPSLAIFKAACTAGALGATFYASKLGRQAHREALERAQGSTDGNSSGDGDSSGDANNTSGAENAGPAQPSSTVQQLRRVQLAVPVLTGAMLVADARLGEQQRPTEVIRGAVERFVPDALQSLPESLHAVPEALQSLPDALHAIPEALQAVPDAIKSAPIGDVSRDALSKAGELGRAASHSSLGEPVRQALHR